MQFTRITRRGRRWLSSQFGDAVKHSGKRANRRIAAGLLWIGPGELVLSDLARAGRIQAGVVLIALAALFAALTRDAAVSLGVRAAIDAVVRLAVLPVHFWSTALVVFDALVITAVLCRPGKEWGQKDRRGSGRG